MLSRDHYHCLYCTCYVVCYTLVLSCVFTYCTFVVDLLGSQWRRAVPGRGMEVTDYIFPTELHQLRSFIQKHDRVTDQLEVFAAKDDFLTGRCVHVCTVCTYTYTKQESILMSHTAFVYYM